MNENCVQFNETELEKINLFLKNGLHMNKSFHDCPVVTKQPALQLYNKTVEGARFFSSTGSSGQPKNIPWTDREDEIYFSEKYAIFKKFLGDCSSLFISLGEGHNASSADRIFGNDPEIHCCRCNLHDASSQIEQIKQMQADSLYMSVSILLSLIKNSADKFPVTVRKIILNGEIVTEGMRNFLCSYFSLTNEDIMDTYGTTEIGTVAYSCAKCNKYHFMPELYPEIMSADCIEDSLLDKGSILLVTSLKRTSFPVVRFATYDLVENLERGFCNGASVFTISKILGRSDDVLSYGELLSTNDLRILMDKYYPAKRFVIFNPENNIDIFIEGRQDSGFLEDFNKAYPMHKEMAGLGLLRPVGFHFRETLPKEVAALIPAVNKHKCPMPIVKCRLPANVL